jgi:hypothetical protein
MVITQILPDKEVKFDMHTLKPWESHATSAFKIMGLFKSLDEMIGGQYERGFESMNKSFAGLRLRSQ